MFVSTVICRARERLRDEEGHESGPSKLQRTDNDDKIAFSLAPKKAIATVLTFLIIQGLCFLRLSCLGFILCSQEGRLCDVLEN